MKKLVISFLLFLLSFFTLCEAKTVQVKGYYKKNGTYVAPHTREVKDSGSSYKSSSSTRPRTSYRPTTGSRSYVESTGQGPRTFSKGLKEKKYHEQGGRCTHCGKSCSYSDMEGDHVIPYSKGGKTDYSNLQMLCAPCNRSKGNRYSY